MIIKRVTTILGMIVLGTAGVAYSQVSWSGQSAIGDTQLVLYDEFSGGFTVETRSSGVTGTADNCYFVYQELSGAFRVKTELFYQISAPATDPAENPKVGIMVRDSLDANAANAFAYITGDNEGLADTYTIQWRPTAGGNTARVSGFGRSGKQISTSSILNEGTVEVERFGKTIYMYYYDLDGQRISLHSQTLDGLSDPVYVGIAFSSGDPDAAVSGDAVNTEIDAFPFSVVRTVPADPFHPGDNVAVKLDATFEAGSSGTATIEEILPEGWSVVSSSPQGTVSGNKISWTINATPGTQTINYTIKSPADKNISAMLSGTVTKGAVSGSVGGDSRLQVFIPYVTSFVDEFDDGDINVNANGAGGGFRDVSQGNATIVEQNGKMVMNPNSGWDFARAIADKDAFDFWNPNGIDIEFVINDTILFQSNANQAYRGLQFGLISSKILEVFEPDNPEHAAVGVDPEHNTVGSIYMSFTDNWNNQHDNRADVYFAIDGPNAPNPDNTSVDSQTLSRLDLPNWDPTGAGGPLTVKIHIDSSGYELEFSSPATVLVGQGLTGTFPAGSFPTEFGYGAYLFVGHQSAADGQTHVERIAITVNQPQDIDSWALY